MALLNRLALVTGAGSGIGEAVCRLFAQEGAKVIAADINVDNVSKLVPELPNRDQHLACKVDVSDSASVESLAMDIIKQYQEAPSIVVHCAGILETHDGLFNLDEKQWDRTINTNLKGTFLINKKFALLMKDAKMKGSIVNIASISAEGYDWCPDYSASKGGMIAFSKGISKELGPYGIRVNCLKPGLIDTPLGQGIGKQKVKEYVQTAPLKRYGAPSETAELCLFLASDKSGYMTGSVVLISGGCQQ